LKNIRIGVFDDNLENLEIKNLIFWQQLISTWNCIITSNVFLDILK